MTDSTPRDRTDRSRGVHILDAIPLCNESDFRFMD